MNIWECILRLLIIVGTFDFEAAKAQARSQRKRKENGVYKTHRFPAKKLFLR